MVAFLPEASWEEIHYNKFPHHPIPSTVAEAGVQMPTRIQRALGDSYAQIVAQMVADSKVEMTRDQHRCPPVDLL